MNYLYKLILIKTVFLYALISQAQLVPGNCSQIYFDRSPQVNNTLGYSQSLLLSNLIRHFSTHRISILPVETYVSGDLLRCQYNFYLGSYYNNFLPQAFLSDALTLPSALVWMGYNVWQLGFLFPQYFNYEFVGLTKLNPGVPDSWGAPSFFSEIKYKNNSYIKYTPGSNLASMHAPFEISILRPVNGNTNPPMAMAFNPWTQESLPYFIGWGNKFYFSEIPLSYMHESNHHLVLADFLQHYFINLPAGVNVNPESSLARNPRVGIVLSTPDFENISNKFFDLAQSLSNEGIPYFLALYPSQAENTKVTPELDGLKRKLLKGAEGIFWDLRLVSQLPLKDPAGIEIIDHVLVMQHYFQDRDLVPLSVLDTTTDRTVLRNSILSQLFPVKIGYSEIYNYVSLDGLNQPVRSSLNWFPFDEKKVKSISFSSPLLIDGFHQSQISPYIIKKDLMNQKVIPLRFNLVSSIDLNRTKDYTRALGSVEDSMHFISIESSFIKTPKDRKNIIQLLKDYQNLNYKFVFKKNFLKSIKD